MYSKSNNTEFMTEDNANDVVDELFELLLPRYQIDLETLTKENDFILIVLSVVLQMSQNKF